MKIQHIKTYAIKAMFTGKFIVVCARIKKRKDLKS